MTFINKEQAENATGRIIERADEKFVELKPIAEAFSERKTDEFIDLAIQTIDRSAGQLTFCAVAIGVLMLITAVVSTVSLILQIRWRN